jgi:hypothetical protein
VLKLADNALSLGLLGGLQSAANEAQVSEQVAEPHAVGSQFCGPPVFLRAVSSARAGGRAECCELIAFAAADGSIFFSVRACLKSGTPSRRKRHDVSDVRVFDLSLWSHGQKAHVASGAFCRGHRRRRARETDASN